MKAKGIVKAQVQTVVIRTIPLTKADEEAIEYIPTDHWFCAWDLTYKIRAWEYRCQRLEKAGILKSRIVGDYPQLSREYHTR
jgi:hypothetical protein